MDTPNEIELCFNKLNRVLYICGLKGFWGGELNMSKGFIKIYDKVIVLMQTMMSFFVFSLAGAIFTQKNLSQKQFADHVGMAVLYSSLSFYYASMCWNRAKVKDLFYHFVVVLRRHHNDKELEQKMIKRIWLYGKLFASLVTSVVFSRGLMAFTDCLMKDVTFTPVITVWPDVNDKSTVAGVVRVAYYIVWWLNAYIITGNMLMLFTIMICNRFQYMNLQNYFCSLDDIFIDEELGHTEKERKFEQKLKLGIHMHVLTLWGTEQSKLVCNHIFGIHVILCIWSLVSTLTTLLSENRDIWSLLDAASLGVISLVSLAFFMWNAGDITIEASNLSEAIYASGWHNCFGKSSVRIRKLVVNAMAQAQKPVVLRAFGFLELSHRTYLSIVKTSYSIVSVFY